jgi:hypothetical protein
LRLKTGESAERGRQQLQALLNAPASRFLRRAIDSTAQTDPRVYAGALRTRLLLLGASTLLLLVACTNIASLFLARVASRSTEFATRIALGAGRASILAQMLAESTVLALLGGVGGAFVAYYGVRVLVAYGPDVALLRDAGINTPVLLFAVLTSVLTGVACGMVPAFRRLEEIQRRCCRKAQGLARRRSRGAPESAVGRRRDGAGTALLASAALLLHSFVNVMDADRGYHVENLLAVDLALSEDRYSTGPQRVGFYRTLNENIAALPGVRAAGAISSAGGR